MKCPMCVEEGKKSVLFGGGSTISTCMSTNNYYDEDGKIHTHDRNVHTSSEYHCSNGHSFRLQWIPTCASCDFGKGSMKVIACQS